MHTTFEARCKSALESLGLCRSEDVLQVRPLAGGVASDIAAVSYEKRICESGNNGVEQRTVCVKFALEKLRVEEDWFAPLHRGKAEYAWLNAASLIVPGAVPTILGWCHAENGFVMEYIDGVNVTLWKSKLLAGTPDSGEAVMVANTIGQIHAGSSLPEFDRTAFNTAADFESLRTEPYLRFTATKYPQLASSLISLADQLSRSRVALVHGDVSPKNILLRAEQAVILDAECATMGDPAFDVAFCLNHLLLKSIHMPAIRDNLLLATLNFWDAYATHIVWESKMELQARVSALLPALMLARVDGKSPVEYLSQPSQEQVRSIAYPLINEPVSTIQAIIKTVQSETAA